MNVLVISYPGTIGWIHEAYGYLELIPVPIVFFTAEGNVVITMCGSEEDFHKRFPEAPVLRQQVLLYATWSSFKSPYMAV